MIHITDKISCCGCEACANICPANCIRMIADEEGFLYPSVDKNSCSSCGLCEKVCPINNTSSYVKENKKKIAMVVQHKDKEILKESTSGGAFSAIAEYVIKRGGVVFGVVLQDNYFIRHICVDNIDDIKKFRNSKYVQSYIGDTYRQVKDYLNTGRIVCFSGTPCQVSALRHFLCKNYDNLILVDIVCRAVPSPGVWKSYINMERRKAGDFKSIRFRDKSLGYQYSTMELINKNGKVLRGGIESQPWLRMFFSGTIIRPSCSECKFRNVNRESDFTIWDCFNIYKIDKSFDEQCGTTRILLHTEKSLKIFDAIKSDIIYKNIPLKIAVNGVDELVKSPKLNSRRKDFFNDYNNMEIDEVIKKYFPYSYKVRLKKGVRIILNKFGLDSKLKHIVKKGK